MYEGIQVATPSLSIPCKIMAVITPIITGENSTFVAADEAGFSNFFVLTGEGVSIQYLFQKKIITIPQRAEQMEQDYIKFLYDHHPGFRLHHTKGQFAGKSTTGHLHYDVELSFIYFMQGSGDSKIEGKNTP